MSEGEQGGGEQTGERRVGPSPGALQAAREAEERARRDAEERERQTTQPAAPQYQPYPTYPAYGQPVQQQQPAPAQPPQEHEDEDEEHPEAHPPPPQYQQPSYPAYPQPPYPPYQQPPPPYGYAQPGWGQTPYGYAPVPYGYEQPRAWPPSPAQRRQEVKSAPDEHPKELPWELAGWWSRVGAQLIDVLIVWVPMLIVLTVFVLLAEGAENGSGSETTFVVLAILSTFGAWAVFLFYAPLLMKRQGDRNGQTWGKQICSIRVIRADGEPMKFADAALRQIIYKSFGMLVLSTFIPLFPWILNYLWPTWDEQHRALHDLAADTRVVAA
jgi:uncharacterized RDD family membrane protein YckC